MLSSGACRSLQGGPLREHRTVCGCGPFPHCVRRREQQLTPNNVSDQCCTILATLLLSHEDAQCVTCAHARQGCVQLPVHEGRFADVDRATVQSRTLCTVKRPCVCHAQWELDSGHGPCSSCQFDFETYPGQWIAATIEGVHDYVPWMHIDDNDQCSVHELVGCRKVPRQFVQTTMRNGEMVGRYAWSRLHARELWGGM